MESEMKFDVPNHNRRVFMLHTLAGASLVATARQAHAATETDAVKETDAYPKSMGFRLNTANVDKVKYPRHTLEQRCSQCQLFKNTAGEPTGNCSFFKRVVPVDGWCRNFKQVKAAT
jgi:hypothetical protein